MNRNSSSTCGRNTITEPTPPHTPSTSRERIGEAGSVVAIHWPETSNSHFTPSISGAAAVKMVWKTAITTATKIATPNIGCRKTESNRRVHKGGAGGEYEALRPTRPAHWRHLGTS